MKLHLSANLLAAILLMLGGTAHAQVLIAGYDSTTSAPVVGTAPIMGVGTSLSDPGFAYTQGDNVDTMDDGDPSTRPTTYLQTADPFSYAGFSFSAPTTNEVTSLTANFWIYNNGGWFGTNGSDPATDTTPLSAYLVEPTLEVTTNGGTSWTVVADSSNYLTTLGSDYTGQAGGNPFSTATVTFTPLSPIASGIDGIRLVGPSGGDGFISVGEADVYAAAPEPSTFAMLFGGLGLLVLVRRVRGFSA